MENNIFIYFIYCYSTVISVLYRRYNDVITVLGSKNGEKWRN